MQTNTQTKKAGSITGNEDSKENAAPDCPKCGRGTVYTKKDGRIRCYRCGYEGLPDEVRS